MLATEMTLLVIFTQKKSNIIIKTLRQKYMGMCFTGLTSVFEKFLPVFYKYYKVA